MKFFTIAVVIILLGSCSKTIDVELPSYDSQMVAEMYLEDGLPLKCLLSESQYYTSDTINSSLDNALVIFSDGNIIDTLSPSNIYDYESGRRYNYSSSRVLKAYGSSVFTLNVADSMNRKIHAETSFAQTIVPIDKLVYSPAVDNKDSFSVGFVISDPAAEENYYRFMIAENINDYTAESIDFSVADIAFNGDTYSFYSEALYARNDTVTVRVYSLLKDHYDYIQSADNARTANVNPFLQPARIRSNVTGGLGIFTAIRYDEKKIIIK